ncbi:MAG: GAF domain-containing protein, partial [Myxococcota bacterium]
MEPDQLLPALSALAGSTDPEALLRTAVDLTVGLVHARLGYAALGRAEDPSWSVLSVADPGDAEATRERVSRTVRALALREGKPILTAAADLDPRFQSGSVRVNGVKAVICAPLGAADAPGVLYVEGAPGMRFTEGQVRLVEGMARLAGQ